MLGSCGKQSKSYWQKFNWGGGGAIIRCLSDHSNSNAEFEFECAIATSPKQKAKKQSKTKTNMARFASVGAVEYENILKGMQARI